MRFSRITAVFLLALNLSAAYAQDSEAPWYQIEVIIFERLEPGAGSTEFWPADPGSPSRLDALPIALTAGRGNADSPNPVPYTALPRSAWQLEELAQRLRHSRNFRPQVHLAWQQQVTAPDQAQPLYIEMMDKRDARSRIDRQPKIEGTLKVGIKRYLHLDVDLLIRRLKQRDAASARPEASPQAAEIQTYRLQAQQRMISGKLYYLDHPIFGVLAMASRYEPPPPPKPEPPAPIPPETQAGAGEPAAVPAASTETPVSNPGNEGE